MKKRFALFLTIILGLGLCGCDANSNEIKMLTENFEVACNRLDFNGMLDCVEPDVSDSVKSVTSFIGMFSDKDTDEILDKVGGVIFKGLPGNSREFFSSMKFDIGDIAVEENTASALAEITYEISGETHTSNADFEYVCIDGKWYISDLGLN